MQSVGGKLNFKEIVMSLFPFVSYESSREVPHPDLEIKGGGGVGAVIQTLRPLDKRGAVSPKILFLPSSLSLVQKYGKGKGGGGVGPPGPSPGSTTAGDNVYSIRRKSPALSS